MMLGAIGFWLCVVADLSHGVPPDEPFLWKRVVEAYGGESLHRLKSLQMEARMGGTFEAITTVWLASDQSYTRWRTAVSDQFTVSEGTLAWHVDENGFKRELGADEQGEGDMAGVLLDFPWALAHARDQLTVTLPTHPTLTHHLEISLAGSHRATLTLDPIHHWLEHAVIAYESGGTWEVSFADYRRIEGVAFPFRTTVTSDSGPYTLEVLTLVVNPPVPTAVLASSVLFLTHVRFVDPAASTVTIPLMTGGGRLRVPLKVNGQKATFLLDTGANADFISPALVNRLSLPRVPYGQAQGVGHETPKVHLVRLSLLEVGGLRYESHVLRSLPLGGDEGLLGYSFLFPLVVELNFLRQEMVVYREGAFRLPPGAVTLSLSLPTGLPMVTAEIKGVGPARLFLDTGYDGGWELYRPFVRKHGLSERPGGAIGGIGGIENIGIVELDEVKLARTSFPKVQAIVTKGGDPLFDGLIGVGFFQRLAGVVFDYRGGRLHLLPKPWFGMRFASAQGDSLTVEGVEPGGPADQAGIQSGDVFTAVGGEAVASLSKFRRLMVGRGVGEAVPVTLRRGEMLRTLTVTLGPSFQ